ncbi:unnamed protein product [Closterium sp. NIES-64]|nr:unnamed protein product [Closterium sp. NIES-64]
MGATIGIVCGVAVVLLALLLAVLFFLYRRNKVSRFGALAAGVCVEFTMKEMQQATNNWADANLLGSGGFGDVFKGVHEMATKHHPNLVRLLGYATCGDLRERIEQILVYEFISNGDLDKWLSAGGWCGVRLFGTVQWSLLRFGILMLVVLTGKPATYEDDKNHSRGILKWVQEKVGQGSLEEIADPRMGTVPPDALQRIADLAMRCTATFTADRPSMGRIAQEMDALRGEVGGGEEQVHKAYEVVDAELRARMQQQQKMSEQSMDSFLDSIHSGKIGSMMDTGEVITGDASLNV